MQNESISADGVHIAGNFQGWDPPTMLMTSNGTDSIYSITLSLPINSFCQYRFINGNSWDDSEIVPSECSVDGNRMIEPYGDTIVPSVCFSNCTICGVGITEISAEKPLILFLPNPFNEYAYLSLDLVFPGRLSIMIYNNSGRSIALIYEGIVSDGHNSFRLDGEKISSGFYYCQVQFESPQMAFSSYVKFNRQ
jgi:hypothetical protein